MFIKYKVLSFVYYILSSSFVFSEKDLLYHQFEFDNVPNYQYIYTLLISTFVGNMRNTLVNRDHDNW